MPWCHLKHVLTQHDDHHRGIKGTSSCSVLPLSLYNSTCSTKTCGQDLILYLGEMMDRNLGRNKYIKDAMQRHRNAEVPENTQGNHMLIYMGAWAIWALDQCWINVSTM